MDWEFWTQQLDEEVLVENGERSHVRQLTNTLRSVYVSHAFAAPSSTCGCLSTCFDRVSPLTRWRLKPTQGPPAADSRGQCFCRSLRVRNSLFWRSVCVCTAVFGAEVFSSRFTLDSKHCYLRVCRCMSCAHLSGHRGCLAFFPYDRDVTAEGEL